MVVFLISSLKLLRENTLAIVVKGFLGRFFYSWHYRASDKVKSFTQ